MLARVKYLIPTVKNNTVEEKYRIINDVYLQTNLMLEIIYILTRCNYGLKELQ